MVIQTVKLAYNHYKTHKSVVLVAQMQSGKTSTYFKIAKKMLKKGVVSNVIVFSAASEKLLKSQMEKRVKKDKSLKRVTEVVFGEKLESYKPNHSIKTLYIWDESHWGQSENQRVKRFCDKCHICPAGIDNVAQTDYLLTVSATPFSEVHDAKESNKLVIFQEPSEGYYGIKHMLETNKIHTFTDLTPCLKDRLEELSKCTKIIIVRIDRKKYKTLVELCKSYNIKVAMFDKDTSGRALIKAIEKKPTESMVVAIKSKLRMGRTIKDKRHVLCCIETSKTTKADTRMQGLLGRFCGYNDPKNGLYQNTEVQFYIHAKSSSAAKEYVTYFDTVGDVTPKTGMNIKHNKKGIHEFGPTIKIPTSYTEQMRSAFDQQNRTEAKKIIDKFIQKTIVRFRSFNEHNQIILVDGVVPKIIGGHGVKLDEVSVYEQGGSFYLVYTTHYKPAGTATTGKEVFCKPLDLHTGNLKGGLRVSSYFSVEDMLEDIHDFICMSKQFSRIQQPIYENVSRTPMSKQVYNALVSGIIHKQMEKMEKVSIKCDIISEHQDTVIVKEIKW